MLGAGPTLNGEHRCYRARTINEGVLVVQDLSKSKTDLLRLVRIIQALDLCHYEPTSAVVPCEVIIRTTSVWG
jgi:hypothetical protein